MEMERRLAGGIKGEGVGLPTGPERRTRIEVIETVRKETEIATAKKKTAIVIEARIETVRKETEIATAKIKMEKAKKKRTENVIETESDSETDIVIVIGTETETEIAIETEIEISTVDDLERAANGIDVIDMIDSETVVVTAGTGEAVCRGKEIATMIVVEEFDHALGEIPRDGRISDESDQDPLTTSDII